MKTSLLRYIVLIQLIILYLTISGWSRCSAQNWQYMFPKSGAQFMPVQTTIILRTPIDLPKNFSPSFISLSVIGEKSGMHPGKIITSDDNRTLIFKPEHIFSVDERVDVEINAEQLDILPIKFNFTTTTITADNRKIVASVSNYLSLSKAASPSVIQKTSTVINGVSVPSDFPTWQVSTVKQTDKGRLFLSYDPNDGPSYIMILENDGTPYFYQRINGPSQEFKILPTGALSRHIYENQNCFVLMDSDCAVIDTIRCGHGYPTNEHELQVLPNGHCLILGNWTHPLANVTVLENIVQELDKQKNVVFEWRPFDYFDISDLIGSTDVHMNSIAVDYDSNLVVSLRDMSQVAKIDRRTGNVLWRLGGARNQFQFINDQNGINFQHDARPVSGEPNHYTIYDNGDPQVTNYSRAVEFVLDTAAKTATKVWEFRHNPDLYSSIMGNAQRLPNGNTLINWAMMPFPKATEVTPEGEVVYEAKFSRDLWCYRNFRFEWEHISKAPYLIPEVYPDRVHLIFNKFGDKNIQRYIIYGGLKTHPTTPLDSTSSTWIDLTNLTNLQTYYFRVTARDSSGKESEYSNEENCFVKLVPLGDNVILNGDFGQGSLYWTLALTDTAQATSEVITPGTYHLNSTNGGSYLTSIQLTQQNILLVSGRKYKFEFDAYAGNSRLMQASFSPCFSVTLNLSTTQKHFSYNVQNTNPTNAQTKLLFNIGKKIGDLYLSNISLKDVTPDALENHSTNPTSFKLEQNYPNPFNPTTTLRYQLPGNNQKYLASLSVFDVLGRKVATLLNETKSSGTYTAHWNAVGCASGVYYCKLAARNLAGAQDFHMVRKILLLK